MKNGIIAVFALFVLTVNFVAPSFADVKSKQGRKHQATQLVSLLPASDAVVSMDAKRVFSEAIPRILSGNQPLLSRTLAMIDEMQSKTGIDLRQFESVAAGVLIKNTAPKKFDFDAVAVARGQINSGAIIAAAKLAVNGKYTEVKIGTRTIYIFSGKDAVKPKSVAVDPKKAEAAAKYFPQMAVSAYDANTIVIGSVSRVSELLAGTTRVSPEISGILGKSETSIVDFAAKVPNGMSGLMPLENDELGKNIDSIRFLYGTLGMEADAALFQTTARTQQPAQAQGLKETLDGLQMLGKAFLGSSKGADKQLYGRLIENVRFAVNGNEVKMDLRIPQSDIDILVGMIR